MSLRKHTASSLPTLIRLKMLIKKIVGVLFRVVSEFIQRRFLNYIGLWKVAIVAYFKP
jgi:hypothetical protein